MYVVDVVINSTARELDRLFSYQIEESLFPFIEPGARVMVPFGKGDRPTEAIVVEKKREDQNGRALKMILSVVDWISMVNKDLMELAKWMSSEYLATMVESFKLVLPPGNFANIRQEIAVPNFIIEKSASSSEKALIDYLNRWVGKGYFRASRLKGKWDEELIRRVLTCLRENSSISIFYSLKDSGESKKVQVVSLTDLQYQPLTNAVREKEILDYLKVKNKVDLEKMKKELKFSSATFRKLIEKRVISMQDSDDDPSSISGTVKRSEKKKLTSEQQKIQEEIMLSNEKEFLIHGVTGSGKTEIYLNLVENTMQEGRDSIVLVPEISLTPQMLDRFMGRFGSKVAVLHSKLTSKERLEEWKKIRNGEVQIAVGARSAVFAPFSNLGLIVIDEEHESSFKSSSGVRYDTVEVARKRIMICNAKMVLGSATPGICTYHSCLQEKRKLLFLKNRITKNPLNLEIVDMSEEMKNGNNSVFSRSLFQSMQSALEKNQQIILFLNRKGYSTSLTCRKCGLTMKCKRCDISLSYYRSKENLKCSYCGSLYSVPKFCPDCGEVIGYFGIGTEMVEELIRRLFPDSVVARMDQESTRSLDAHDRIYREMLNGEIDILIGTQMLSKGLDFPRVSLVGVLMADMSLNIPDYRSHERTFQLLSQVSGRAGRANIPGKAIIQTYNPEHFVIQSVQSSSYENFYENEILLRKEFFYPPFCELILVGFTGEKREKVREKAEEFFYLWKRGCSELNMDIEGQYLGPNPAPIEWINKKYRYHLLLKVKKEQIYLMKHLLNRVYKQTASRKDSVRTVIDINPASIM